MLGGNCPGAIIWGKFSKVGIVQGVTVREVIVWGAIAAGGNCLGGELSEGNCPRWQLSRGELSCSLKKDGNVLSTTKHLSVMNVSAKDSGLYDCTASNVVE